MHANGSSGLVSIIDYGIGNLLSVRRVFEDLGAQVELVDTPESVLNARCLVLPGVGAFADGMRGLHARGLVEPIRQYAALAEAGGNPFLGICLGMQMMFDASEEFGAHAGLGLVPGRVVAIPAQGIDGLPHKIPHIGWSSLVLPPAHRSWDETLFQGLPYGEEMYFVHSFTAVPARDVDRLADCHYHGLVISAAVGRGNLFGVQFHPEKSGPSGRHLIRNLMSIKVLEQALRGPAFAGVA
jgi:imidazole glycerol-phosphate synthase subunit HisH